MAQHPHKKHRSPAQMAASRNWASAGRRSQASTRAQAIAKTGKPPPRTAKQKTATQNWASAGRSAQKARRSGKAPAPKKKAAAPVPDTWVRSGVKSGEVSLLDGLDACGPVALAEHLAYWTGTLVLDAGIVALYRELGGAAALADMFEHITTRGFGGERLAYFGRCDPDCGAPGLIYGLQLPYGYHAALAVPGGMLSWGLLVPRAGTPEEAWWLEWEGE